MKSIADFFLIGVALLSFLAITEAAALAGVHGSLDAVPENNSSEE